MPIDCARFFRALGDAGVGVFAGVPDSLLASVCAYVSDHAPAGRHYRAANEGAAIALATGHYLATGELGLVYMQNSGLGNSVNPLVSLVDPEVYGIPLLLLVGWRGEPGIPDEPQHRKQGRITTPLLETLEIPHFVLPESEEQALACVASAALAAGAGRAAALVARQGAFAAYSAGDSARSAGDALPLDRESVVRTLVERLPPHALVVSTTGKTSRELFETRARLGHDTRRDFLTVGSMGHASQIALGVAGARPERRVVCLDGDGAVIMHMGSLASIGSVRPSNFTHVVVNNGAHDSVGGQPTAGFEIDLAAVARACGYRAAACASTAEELDARLASALGDTGPTLLEVRVRRGARADLGRPSGTPADNKAGFMEGMRAKGWGGWRDSNP
jgi:phosphonopyruvate decarboxylase